MKTIVRVALVLAAIALAFWLGFHDSHDQRRAPAPADAASR
jgi:hypothetical protein